MTEQATVRIEAVDTVTDALIEAFDTLIPQLSRSNPPPDRQMLEKIVGSDASTILVAHDLLANDRIVGAMTLVTFTIPTGVRAWIEDVVVDTEARGRGIGELLNREAIELAVAKGAKTVDLTSRPSREAANRLYKRIGFEARETNIYRLTP